MAEKADRVTQERLEKDIAEASGRLAASRPASDEGTFLRRLADSCIEMAACYVSDAGHFTDDGDRVTALAAANYASEWIGCSEKAGILDVSQDAAPAEAIRCGRCSVDTITDARMAKYLDITRRARLAVAMAPPERSFGIRMAQWCLSESDALYAEAVSLAEALDYVDAFATVNRSHAWLDFGARTGLFDVGGDDVLFTLYERVSHGSSKSTDTS